LKIPIQYGNYYHIYNRGNNRSDIFQTEEDYLHFLNLYAIFIDSVADTFAWCLMKNHFHFLLRIKNQEEIGCLDSRKAKSDDLDQKWKTYFPDIPDINFTKKPSPASQFQHLFNAYSRWFNKKYKRSGALFESTFDRKLVNHKKYFKNMIIYIHQNPIKHGFADHILDYPWRSYLSIQTNKPTRLKRETVISEFGSIDFFKRNHDHIQEDFTIEHLIIE